jgi:hypothetical protein
VSATKVDLVNAASVYGQDAPFPAIIYIGTDGDRLLGAGGLAWHHDRCWLWVDKVDKQSANPFTLVRWGRRMLQVAKRYGDTVVSAVRDDQEANSAKLLQLLGFVLVDPEGVVMADGTKAELWECRLG